MQAIAREKEIDTVAQYGGDMIEKELGTEGTYDAFKGATQQEIVDSTVELTRRSATLRKRFGRIKSDLKKLLESRLAERDR